MRRKLKNRLTVILILLSFFVISMVSITIIFALTQQKIETEIGLDYEAPAIDALTFTANSDGQSYSITACDDEKLANTNGVVIIPKTYNNLPVTSIGDAVFQIKNNLKQVIVQEGVTSIGYGCFAMSTIESVVFPDSLIIEEDQYGYCHSTQMFYGCASLESVTLPSGMKLIPELMFYGCMSLKNLTIPNTVTKIGNNAFTDCSSLTSVVLPDSLTYIPGGCFHNCTSLTDINIPSGVTTIYGDTFNGCKLGSIEIPASVTRIEDVAFCNAGITGELVIPDTVTYLGAGAFMSNPGITKITVGSGVSELLSAVFANITNLTEVVYTSNVTHIDNVAFGGCTSLSNFTVKSSVLAIEQGAFADCTSLTNVTFEDPNSWYVADSEDATSGTNLSSTNLANTSTAATYLKSTYVSYYWKRAN